MTSKQVKEAYKKATKTPTMTKAERRRWEKEEQERIRKEFEKEKAAAKARAARERKKEKELAEMEKKRKSGLPLVKVRPSQDTIARFVRGNGSGKKRDSAGSTVEQPERSILEEVTDESDARDTPVPEGEPVVPPPENNETTTCVPEKDPIQDDTPEIETAAPVPSPVVVQSDAQKVTSPEVDDLEFEEDSQEMSLLEDALKEVDKIEQSARQREPKEAETTYPAPPSNPKPPVARQAVEEEFFGASLEDSAFEDAFGDELFEKPVPATVAVEPMPSPAPQHPEAEPTLSSELKDMVDDLDLDLFSEIDDLGLQMLDTLENAAANAANKPITPPASTSKQNKPQATSAGKSPTPLAHTSRPPHTKSPHPLPPPRTEPCFAKPALPVHTPRKSPRLSGSHSSSPASHIPTPPLSTQAILSNIDDLFPSSSQQARELEEEFPCSYVPAAKPLQHNPSPRPLSHAPPARSTPYQPPPVQTKPTNAPRFFTSSGGREQLSLALHRSRRTAAMEQLQEKERAKREAGLAIQQSKHEAKLASRAQKACAPVKTVVVPNKENVLPVPGSQESEYGGAWLDDIALDMAF